LYERQPLPTGELFQRFSDQSALSFSLQLLLNIRSVGGDFLYITDEFPVKAQIVEVDNSGIFCEITI